MHSKVNSTELRIGMYIESLDRPWLDTPFLLQGFLIEEQEELVQLRQYCQYVIVDWDRSTLAPPPGLKAEQRDSRAEHVRNPSPQRVIRHEIRTGKPVPAAETENDTSAKRVQAEPVPVNRPPNVTWQQDYGRAGRAGSDPQVYDDGDYRDFEHQGLLSDVAYRVRELFRIGRDASPPGRKGKLPPAAQENKPPPYVRPSFIPSSIVLTEYVEAKPVEEEFRPARRAHVQINLAIESLYRDITENRKFAFAETEAAVKEVVDSMMRNPDAMMWVSRIRKQDETVYGHSLMVAVNMVALGRHLGLPQEMLDRLCMSGLLLDIGKTRLSRELLSKTGRLSKDEFEMVKSHVQLALDILQETPDLDTEVMQGIAQHHEREDGSGYPAGLINGQISMFGRISAIVDAFSALTNPRPYAETMSAYDALQCLVNFNPGLFQETMLEQLIQAIGVFPVGSMVELSTGEVAIVVSHSKVRRLKPRVMIISDPDKRPVTQPASLDLLYQPMLAESDEVYIQRGLSAGAYGLDAREYFLH